MRNQIALMVIAVSCFATPAMAQTDKAPAPDCPAQYELIGGTLCMKVSNGDIVLPTTPATAVRYSNVNCRTGYEILVANQCMNPRTGDIVFADEGSVTQTAKN